jgi:hypothetical protein
MRAWYAAAFLLLTCPISATAQEIPERFARWEAAVVVPPDADSLQASVGDYRYEGIAFGGLVFGALGAYLGSRGFGGACPLQPGIRCGQDHDRLGNGIVGGLLGAAVGGGLGYLVGRFSPKKPRPVLVSPATTLPTVPDSIRKRVGYQHWRGAGVGSAIGAGVGALLGLIGPIGCSDCNPPSRGETIVTVGLLGAATGGVVGFLAGLASPKYVWAPADASPEPAPR